MNTSYFLRAFYVNTVIAGIFIFVFLSTLSQVYAQPVNPGGNGGGVYVYNTPVYQSESYGYNQPTYTNTFVNTAPRQSISVHTYEPGFLVRDEDVSVSFKGFIDVPDSYVTSYVWFEWGETPALENKTSSQTVNISFSFQTTVSGLKPNKTYYYRAAGQNAEQGMVYGSTVTVRTPSVATNQSAETGSVQGASTNTFLGWPFGTMFRDTKKTEAATSTDITKEEPSTVITTEKSTSTDAVGGLFPGTFLGWGILTILVFIVVGFVLYLLDLYQELKAREEEEKKRRANGNGAYANGGASR